MRTTEFLTRRIRRLADALTTLKDRVRTAVAAELGRVVGAAVQDVLGDLARGHPEPLSAHAADRDEWDDDEEDYESVRPIPIRDPLPPPAAGPDRWPHAVAVGSGLARWWLARGGPAWVAGVLGLAAGFAAGCGGPLVQAGVRVVVLAAELAAHAPLFHLPH